MHEPRITFPWKENDPSRPVYRICEQSELACNKNNSVHDFHVRQKIVPTCMKFLPALNEKLISNGVAIS
jgi:hypothetical protein